MSDGNGQLLNCVSSSVNVDGSLDISKSLPIKMSEGRPSNQKEFNGIYIQIYF